MAGWKVPSVRSPERYSKYSPSNFHFFNSGGHFSIRLEEICCFPFFHHMWDLSMLLKLKHWDNFPFLFFVWIITTLKHQVCKILTVACEKVKGQCNSRKTTNSHRLIFQNYFPSQLCVLVLWNTRYNVLNTTLCLHHDGFLIYSTI